ncbi:MAG: hypothetical protein Fur0041_00140 [Bacteroidia bacterium]
MVIILSHHVVAQDKHYTDSLEKSLFKEQADTTRIKAYNKLADAYRYSDPGKNIKYAQQAIALSKSTGYVSGLANGYNLLAQGYENQGHFAKALSFYDSSLTIWKNEKNDVNEAKILLNIANVYNKTADYSTAADYTTRSMKLQEKAGNTFGVAVCKMTLGNIYYGQDDYKTALIHFIGALEMNSKSEKNPVFAASVYSNIGAILVQKENYDSALVFFKKSYHLFDSLHAKSKMAAMLNNIGDCYYNLDQLDTAEKILQQAFVLNNELNRPDGMAISMRVLGHVYFKKEKYEKARSNYLASLKIGKSFNLKEEILSSYYSLSDVYPKIGKADSGIYYLKQFIALNDSVHGDAQLRKIEQLQQDYEYAKKEQLIKLEQAKAELESESLKRKVIILIAVIIGISLLAVLLYYRFRSKRTMALLLENKNKEILQHQEEITDSINYARRIQESILPPMHVVERLLPDSFILYLPKDIVSGDFYWVEEKDNRVHFAAVDCTGHGVPGALMSVVGFNLLNQAVHESGCSKPADILHHLDFGVNKLLRQSTEENTVKDGMDLALCSYDKAGRTLEYAGVMNPLYHVRNKVLTTYKADKFPIGINVDGVTDIYTNQLVEIQKGDMVYLFSDGYCDQFGGEKGKKFKNQPFRELLIQISEKSPEDQKRILRDEFMKWKGSLEQVDDVLVIGVRIS